MPSGDDEISTLISQKKDQIPFRCNSRFDTGITSYSFIIRKEPTYTTRVITKARLLTRNEHMEMFRKNIEQKKEDEEAKSECKRKTEQQKKLKEK